MVMAQGYQNASEDIRELVSSSLARATERDHVFIQRASTALGEWTRAYQAAVGSQANLPVFDLLRRWDQVRAAGNRLADEILSLTVTETEENSSAEILRALIPACFSRIRARSEAVFRTMNADLPSLLCRFVSGEQAGQMLTSICTTMCNYNIEMCGMALSQTVVPVYAIPTTYQTQRSLWQSICQIIPGIAQHTGSELRSSGTRAPNNTPFDVKTQPNTPAGGSGDPGASANPTDQGESAGAQPPTSSSGVATQQSTGPPGAPIGIPPKGCVMVPKSAFGTGPTVDLTREPRSSQTGNIGAPQQTSTPIRQQRPPDRSSSGKKMDISKIQAVHLLNKMSDRREAASPASSRTAIASSNSGGNLPPGLPARAPGLDVGDTTHSLSRGTRAEEVPCHSQQVPKAKPVAPVESSRTGKRPAPVDDADEDPDIEVEEIIRPPKKKKRKKDKCERKESIASENPDDGAEPSTSGVAEPEVEKPEASETPKKKKKKKEKKSALERFEEEQQKQKARTLARARHRRIQHARDFPAVITYRGTLDPASLETINGADHMAFLSQVANTPGLYLNQKNGKERNVLNMDQLLKVIAKRAEDKIKAKRLKEAREMMEATFSMVTGMPHHDKHKPLLAIRCLMDCNGNVIDSDHQTYGKEQNVGLHGLIHPAAMSRVTTKETFDIDGHDTTVTVDHAYCPFCSYSCLAHWVINNHVRMHFRSILFCGWPGCFYVCMLAQNMLDHSRDKHSMKRAPPLQDRKRRSRDPDEEEDDD